MGARIVAGLVGWWVRAWQGCAFGHGSRLWERRQVRGRGRLFLVCERCGDGVLALDRSRPARRRKVRAPRVAAVARVTVASSIETAAGAFDGLAAAAQVAGDAFTLFARGVR